MSDQAELISLSADGRIVRENRIDQRTKKDWGRSTMQRKSIWGRKGQKISQGRFYGTILDGRGKRMMKKEGKKEEKGEKEDKEGGVRKKEEEDEEDEEEEEEKEED